jgi:hypothetical protein
MGQSVLLAGQLRQQVSWMAGPARRARLSSLRAGRTASSNREAGGKNVARPTWRTLYLLINAFFGASSGDHSLNEVFRKNSEPVLDPIVSLL